MLSGEHTLSHRDDHRPSDGHVITQTNYNCQ